MTRNGQELPCDGGGEWPLRALAGEVSVRLKDGRSIDFSLAGEEPLVFKMKKGWSGDGRNVTSVTRGHFLVIAPRTWKRTGHVSVKPEPCSDSDLLAHFFTEDSEFAPERSDFEGHPIARRGSGFELTGKQVLDDSDDGNLFVREPPTLRASRDVVWARVGEERTGGWRGENFKPAEKALDEVLAGRQGRFFVRVYDDREGRLLDSGQFRYLRALKDVLVNGAPYSQKTLLLSPPSGHPPTEVRFAAEPGAVIRPALASGTNESVKASGDGLVAQPTPGADDISCRLEVEPDGGRVDIRLTLPRVWWRLVRGADEDEDAGDWRDKPLLLTSRIEFQELADQDEEVWLHVPDRIKSVQVGFDHEDGSRYPSSKGKVTLPLAHFRDHRQIDERLFNDALLNARFGEPSHLGDQDDRVTLCLVRVGADPLPEILSFQCEPEIAESGVPVTLRWETRNAGEGVSVAIEPSIGAVEPVGNVIVVLSETTTYTLKLTALGMAEVTSQVAARVRSQLVDGEKPIAFVRRAGGWRPGKGFSQREVEAAGLPAVVARSRLVPLDSRRRSEHCRNIETLRRWRDG